jgi:predicted nucleic acid-binding protein
VATKRLQLTRLDGRIAHGAIALTARQALRGYDATHLATAIVANRGLARRKLPVLTFVSADHTLLAAAIAEGLAIENPDNH